MKAELMQRYSKIILRGGAKEVSKLIELIDLFVRRRSEYELIATTTKGISRNENQPALLKSGFFGSSELLGLLLRMYGEEPTSIRMNVLFTAIERLVEHGYIVDNSDTVASGGPARYMFNAKLLASSWDPILAENICCGWLFIIDRYRASVPALVVETNAGDEALATAFLLRIGSPPGAAVLITNKHVAGESEISRVRRAEVAGATYTMNGLFASAKYDLAAISVSVTPTVHHFRLWAGAMLDEVVTLGYPKVAIAAEHRLLAHKGELNGTVVNRYDNNEYAVISCAVAPGNSGGPVLDDVGRVVGVVCQSSIGRYLRSDDGQPDIGVHHLALPAGAVGTFVSSEVLPWLTAGCPPTKS